MQILHPSLLIRGFVNKIPHPIYIHQHFSMWMLKLALQLFSASVADGIILHWGIHYDGFVGSEETENFTRDVTVLIHILNSSTTATTLHLQCSSYDNLKKRSMNNTIHLPSWSFRVFTYYNSEHIRINTIFVQQ